jgi:hypothetical protein
MLITREDVRFYFPVSYFCTTYQMIMTTRTLVFSLNALPIYTCTPVPIAARTWQS